MNYRSSRVAVRATGSPSLLSDVQVNAPDNSRESKEKQLGILAGKTTRGGGRKAKKNLERQRIQTFGIDERGGGLGTTVPNHSVSIKSTVASPWKTSIHIVLFHYEKYRNNTIIFSSKRQPLPTTSRATAYIKPLFVNASQPDKIESRPTNKRIICKNPPPMPCPSSSEPNYC
jgi:hypothetical protein